MCLAKRPSLDEDDIPLSDVIKAKKLQSTGSTDSPTPPSSPLPETQKRLEGTESKGALFDEGGMAKQGTSTEKKDATRKDTTEEKKSVDKEHTGGVWDVNRETENANNDTNDSDDEVMILSFTLAEPREIRVKIEPQADPVVSEKPPTTPETPASPTKRKVPNGSAVCRADPRSGSDDGSNKCPRIDGMSSNNVNNDGNVGCKSGSRSASSDSKIEYIGGSVLSSSQLTAPTAATPSSVTTPIERPSIFAAHSILKPISAYQESSVNKVVVEKRVTFKLDLMPKCDLSKQTTGEKRGRPRKSPLIAPPSKKQKIDKALEGMESGNSNSIRKAGETRGRPKKHPPVAAPLSKKQKIDEALKGMESGNSKSQAMSALLPGSSDATTRKPKSTMPAPPPTKVVAKPAAITKPAVVAKPVISGHPATPTEATIAHEQLEAAALKKRQDRLQANSQKLAPANSTTAELPTSSVADGGSSSVVNADDGKVKCTSVFDQTVSPEELAKPAASSLNVISAVGLLNPQKSMPDTVPEKRTLEASKDPLSIAQLEAAALKKHQDKHQGNSQKTPSPNSATTEPPKASATANITKNASASFVADGDTSRVVNADEGKVPVASAMTSEDDSAVSPEATPAELADPVSSPNAISAVSLLNPQEPGDSKMQVPEKGTLDVSEDPLSMAQKAMDTINLTLSASKDPRILLNAQARQQEAQVRLLARIPQKQAPSQKDIVQPAVAPCDAQTEMTRQAENPKLKHTEQKTTEQLKQTEKTKPPKQAEQQPKQTELPKQTEQPKHADQQPKQAELSEQTTGQTEQLTQVEQPKPAEPQTEKTSKRKDQSEHYQAYLLPRHYAMVSRPAPPPTTVQPQLPVAQPRFQPSPLIPGFTYLLPSQPSSSPPSFALLQTPVCLQAASSSRPQLPNLSETMHTRTASEPMAKQTVMQEKTWRCVNGCRVTVSSPLSFACHLQREHMMPLTAAYLAPLGLANCPRCLGVVTADDLSRHLSICAGTYPFVLLDVVPPKECWVWWDVEQQWVQGTVSSVNNGVCPPTYRVHYPNQNFEEEAFHRISTTLPPSNVRCEPEPAEKTSNQAQPTSDNGTNSSIVPVPPAPNPSPSLLPVSNSLPNNPAAEGDGPCLLRSAPDPTNVHTSPEAYLKGHPVINSQSQDKRAPSSQVRQGFLDAMCSSCPEEQPLVLIGLERVVYEKANGSILHYSQLSREYLSLCKATSA